MEDQLKNIESKINQLLKKYASAQKDIARLQKENLQLKQDISNHTEVAKDLHNKVDALKISAGTIPDEAKKELEKRINTYLREIDKCLALLNN